MNKTSVPCYERLYHAIRVRRTPILLLLGVLIFASVAGIRWLPFENSIDIMLPDGAARKAVRFLAEANLTDKVVISIEKADPALGEGEFIAITDHFAEVLRSPLLTLIDPGAAAAGSMGSINQLLLCAPQLFDEEEVVKAEAALQPGAIDRLSRDLYEDLAKPGSFVAAKLARQDPLKIQRAILGRLEQLSGANLYEVSLENGHLFSRDRNHLLLVFNTPVAITDATGSRNLVAHLQNQAAKLPPEVRADIVCGHLHTVSNERIIKQDIERTSWIGTIAFILIFAVVFRDWRSVAMLAITVCSTLLALPLVALCHGQLSYLVPGLSMVIIGISSDYGIYVYVVTRRSANPARAVGKIIRPMGLGMATTLAVFIAVYFSRIEGCRQLATFAILSIIMAYLASIFLLPHLLRQSVTNNFDVSRGGALTKGAAHPRAWAAIAASAFLGGLVLMAQGRLSTNIGLLDGVEQSVLDAESNFEKTWSAGGSGQGILAVTGATYEEALQRSETIYDKLAGQTGNRILSFSILWRSEASRAANIARWNAFWSSDRITSLKHHLLESGKRHGFSAGAFQPFFDQLATAPALYEPVDNPIFSLIKDRFVRPTSQGYTIYSFFPDTPEYASLVADLAHTVPGAYCVSRRLLTETFAESIGWTFRTVATLSLTLVLLLTLTFSPTWRGALISLVPSIIGVLWGLGIPAALFHTLNICHITAAAVVFGLCVDYGIYMTHAIANHAEENGKITIILTTATSIIGAGVLLFAHHPVLFAIGVTLAVGMLAGHITAIWAVPALVKLFGDKNIERESAGYVPGNPPLKKSPAILLLALLAALALPRSAHADTDTAPAGINCSGHSGPTRYEAVSSVVLQYRWIKFPALGVISVDVLKHNFALVGLSQLGINIFELSQKEGVLKSRMPEKILQYNPGIPAGAAENVRNMFFDLDPPGTAVACGGNDKLLVYKQNTPKGLLEYRFNKQTRLLAEKRFSVPCKFWPGNTVVWVVRYEDYATSGQVIFPRKIHFKHRALHYAITNFVKEMRIK